MTVQHPHDVYPSCQPVLEVEDVSRAVKFYCETLGFELDFEYGDPPVYACVGRPFATTGSPTYIRFTEWCRDRSRVANSGWLSILVDRGLDELYENYCSRGVEIAQQIGDREWGMREFEIRDCDGHYLRFGWMIKTG